MSEIYKELSFETTIPSSILINENIELKAVKLFAFIKGLTKLYGYCFATNDYLANLMKADVSSIKRWLAMLKKEGYVDIETERNKVQWQRRIYLSDRFKKCLRRLMDALPPAHGCATPSSPVSYITKDNPNVNSKEIQPNPLKGEVELYGKFVQLTKEEYVELSVNLGGSEKLNAIIEEINDYLASTGKKPYKDYAATIRNWMRRRKDKEPSKNHQKNTNQPSEGENRNWWNNLVKILHPYIKEGKIYEGSSHVEFSVRGNIPEKIYFNNPQFQTMCKSFLRKMEIFV